jgi:haloacetate dehalogenase
MSSACEEARMFSGFASSVVDAGETTIFIRRKGSGRPLLLLHGFPQTHVILRISARVAVSCVRYSSSGARVVPWTPGMQRRAGR